MKGFINMDEQEIENFVLTVELLQESLEEDERREIEAKIQRNLHHQ